jgi:hypothetical protein
MKSTPTSAITEPTDNSMPPVMMTKAWPIADRPKSPTRLEVLAMLTGSRIENGHDRADSQDQDEKEEVFLIHAVPA